jgi:DNA-directed RNA polymerase specialized sigma24 family protein
MEDPSLIGVSLPDQETLLIEAEERDEREKLKQQIAIAFFTCLTDIQQARMWLYAIEGLTTREIASLEKVSQKNVVISITKARKNILSFLEKGGYQNPYFAAYSEGAIKNPS